MNKYEINMLESEQSKTDRLIDIMGKDRHHIDDLYSQIQSTTNQQLLEQQTEN